MKILLTDDHRMIRQGLRSILKGVYPSAQFLEADNADDAHEIIFREQPDVILLDISMPGRSGIDLLKELKEKNGAAKVLVVSMHTEPDWVAAAAAAGALGYLAKECDSTELLEAVRHVASGQPYFGKSTPRPGKKS